MSENKKIRLYLMTTKWTLSKQSYPNILISRKYISSSFFYNLCYHLGTLFVRHSFDYTCTNSCKILSKCVLFPTIFNNFNNSAVSLFSSKNLCIIYSTFKMLLSCCLCIQCRCFSTNILTTSPINHRLMIGKFVI